MLHYHPDLVRFDLILDDGPADFPPYDMYPIRTEWVPSSGVLETSARLIPAFSRMPRMRSGGYSIQSAAL